MVHFFSTLLLSLIVEIVGSWRNILQSTNLNITSYSLTNLLIYPKDKLHLGHRQFV